MEHLPPIGILKLIAKAIEYKFPGTCTELIADLDKASHNPLYLRYRYNELKEKWDDCKDHFTNSEVAEISSQSGFNLSDPLSWSAFNATLANDIADSASSVAEIASGSAEVVSDVAETASDAVETASGAKSIIEAIIDFFT